MLIYNKKGEEKKLPVASKKQLHMQIARESIRSRVGGSRLTSLPMRSELTSSPSACLRRHETYPSGIDHGANSNFTSVIPTLDLRGGI